MVRLADTFGAMRAQRAVTAFLLTLTLLSLPIIWLLATQDHYGLHMVANGWHPRWGDLWMPLLTHLADGVTLLLVGIVVLFTCSLRGTLLYAGATLLTALVVQFLKRQVFAEVRRPGHFLTEMPDLRLVEGVVLNHHHSFPSGHAAAAFAMCFALAVIWGRREGAVLLALLATLLAYTRVYLSQHFLVDVLAGALLAGSLSATVYALLYRTSWGRATRLDRRAFRQPPK